MGEPTVIVLPGTGDNSQQSTQSPEQISATIQRALHEKSNPTAEQDGPLKQVLAHQDSLYKYISWEDPVRTLGAYAGAMSVLVGAHYLPLTQWALKAGMTTLGVVSVTEFASRSFSSDSLSTRLRPKQYRTFPESTLNATLRDLHDIIQSGAIQAQKIMYGEDLEKAFGAFIGFTALYGLVQVVAPFWLAVMALTSIFIAPLVNSPQGRKAAQEASARAQDLANATAEKSKQLAQNGQAQASELTSKAQQVAHNAGNSVANTAMNGKQTAADLSNRAMNTASNLSGTAADRAGNAGANISQTAQDGKHAAVNMSSQARDGAANATGYAADNVGKVPQAGANVLNNASESVSSAFGNVKQYMSGSSSQAPSHSNGGASGGNYTRDQGGYNDNSANQGAHSTAGTTGGNYNRDQGGFQDGSASRGMHNTDGMSGGDYARDRDTDFVDVPASQAAHSTKVVVEPPRLSAVDDVTKRIF